jgi:hypothetical protein
MAASGYRFLSITRNETVVPVAAGVNYGIMSLSNPANSTQLLYVATYQAWSCQASGGGNIGHALFSRIRQVTAVTGSAGVLTPVVEGSSRDAQAGLARYGTPATPLTYTGGVEAEVVLASNEDTYIVTALAPVLLPGETMVWSVKTILNSVYLGLTLFWWLAEVSP